jgi:hypothetical protein
MYCWVLVTHTCNPSYLGGRGLEDHGSKPAWANSWQDPISKIPITKKGWWSGTRWSPWVWAPAPHTQKKIVSFTGKFIKLMPYSVRKARNHCSFLVFWNKIPPWRVPRKLLDFSSISHLYFCQTRNLAKDKQSWRCGSGCRMTAWQVQSPEFKFLYHKNTPKNR